MMAGSGKKIDAMEKALRILNFRACSELELRRKLRTAGYSSTETADAIERCRKLGVLNDRLLAEDYARSLSDRGCGARMVRFRLGRRGLGTRSIEAALEATAEGEAEACRRHWRPNCARSNEKAIRAENGRRRSGFWRDGDFPPTGSGRRLQKPTFPAEQRRNATMRILLIEDDARTAEFILKGLAQSGYTTIHASDGADGLFKARHENCDLAIIDIMLPKMDGFTVIEKLRARGFHPAGDRAQRPQFGRGPDQGTPERR